ncbi:MAG: TolC family protein [Verrucomicrobia bacterium]|nr:TolC family protein [Verrucomicrobiota bacterium]
MTPQSLTLRDALVLALRQNPDIRVEETSPLIAAAITEQRRGFFDPRLEGSYTFRSVERQQNTQEFISSGGSFGTAPRIFDEQSHRLNLNVATRLEWGTQIEAGMRTSKVNNSIIRTSPQAMFASEHETFIGVTVRQPLMQGFGRSANTIAIRIARKNEEVEQMRLLGTIYGVSAQVASSWYDLLFAKAQRDVRRSEVAALKAVLDEQMLQVERGLLSMRQFSAAHAELAEAEEQAIQAEINFS